MGSTGFTLPEHDLRLALNDEVHARPSVRLGGAQRVVHVAVRHRPEDRAAHRKVLAERAAEAGTHSVAGADHAVVTIAPGLRLKWEGHTEFSSYTVFAQDAGEATPAVVLERAGWPSLAASVPGEVLVAVCVDLVPFTGDSPPCRRLPHAGRYRGGRRAGRRTRLGLCGFSDSRRRLHPLPRPEWRDGHGSGGANGAAPDRDRDLPHHGAHRLSGGARGLTRPQRDGNGACGHRRAHRRRDTPGRGEAPRRSHAPGRASRASAKRHALSLRGGRGLRGDRRAPSCGASRGAHSGAFHHRGIPAPSPRAGHGHVPQRLPANRQPRRARGAGERPACARAWTSHASSRTRCSSRR